MALMDDVRGLVLRLGPRGWGALMVQHGLRLDAIDLAAELQRPLVDANGHSTIDRTRPGFEDFSPQGRAAIEAGDPARSLLFHALASPEVHPAPMNARSDGDYPTLVELDTLENYIYSLARRRLADLGDVVVAVFAHQYRPGRSSVHGGHADMAYARTGVARVGTQAPHYDAPRRSFWVAAAAGAAGTAVLPARYAAFLAHRRRLTPRDAVVHPLQGPLPGDATREFLIPVHKLFAGTECLVGENVQLQYQEFHRSEKLRRIHVLAQAQGGVPPLPGFNVNQSPFVRESTELVRLQPSGTCALVVSQPGPTLAETAVQFNSASGRNEIVRFRVPPANGQNRFITSFQIPFTAAGRPAPEYAHIRFHVRASGQLFDLNLLDTAAYRRVLATAELRNVPGVEDGPLVAAHLLDASCEGVVSAQVRLSQSLPGYAAMSLVSAPDYLPLVGQIDVQRWAERRGLATDAYFDQGGPAPLCYGRDVLPNPTLVDPQDPGRPAFARQDAVNRTITALLGPAPRGQTAPAAGKGPVSTTWLTDGAANVFAPGWDTAMFGDAQGAFYTNYGLGSPFPEDAKLCAALNSFWPAAAPDAGRTFGGVTALPLLDNELGLHPRHPRVLAGQDISQPGWDGEFGPFFAAAGAQVNHASIEHSDYSAAALSDQLGLGLLGAITAEEQLARMDAYRECVERIHGPRVADYRGLLVTAEKVTDWSLRADRFDASLTGPGYHYVFAETGQAQEDPTDRRRQVAPVQRRHICQISPHRVGLQSDNAAPVVTPWRHP